ncbi:MAG: DUF349 domain-containing protein [Crocinitomicaceae bacterium]|nr:DUF349 domain-containing protein [Crocinitomicaceae bacterium]
MKAELIQKLEELAKQEVVLPLEEEFNELVDEFEKLQSEEERNWELKKLERIEGGEKPEAIEKPVFELFEEYKAIKTLFREKKNAEIRAIKETEKKNLEQKRTLIAGLKDLIQNEENIGRAINRFKDIRESWNEVGPIPRDKRQDIQKEYSALVDTFQYNINIYKDIKDHDLSRNLDLKKGIIEELKGLLEMTQIRDVEKNLNALQDKWNSIGGTRQEDWEVVKEEYWNIVNSIYDKIRAFYEERKSKQAENIVLKKEIIVKAQEILGRERSEHKHWKKSTDQILALQEDWKKIGYGPKEENDTVWEEFRGVCNQFFDQKKAFYDVRKEEFSGVKEAKEKLIEEVTAVCESTDWGAATKQIVAIQKKWKNLGSAGPKHENKLWKQFRAPIDKFFEAKDSSFKEKDEANAANLEAKKALIADLEKYTPNKDAKKAIEELQEFSKKFKEIGNVPFKEKDGIYKAYKAALDEKYSALDMDKKEKNKVMFQAKLDSFSGDRRGDMLDKESSFIRKKIGNLTNDLSKYETNLSFFANADSSNPLLKNVHDNIEKTKKEIDGLKEQLAMIRKAAKSE